MPRHPREMQLHPARDSVTLDFYSASAPVYVASGTRGVSRHLPSFLDLLPPRARILELGCGGGWDAGAMIAAGFDVDPTDGTPEIARKAEERLGRRVRVMRFDELDALEVYDAIWASASLLHVPRSSLPRFGRGPVNLGSWHVRDVTPAATRAAAIKGGADIPARSPFMLRPRCRTLRALSCSDPYQATKGGVVNMTRALAAEWAPSGIRVNAVTPTWVRTNLTAPLLDQPGVVERIAALTPLKRLAAPDEITWAILHLASPAAAMVTGHTLAVDGGFLAQ